MTVFSKHEKPQLTLRKWVQSPSVKRGRGSPFQPKVGHREKDLKSSSGELPWGCSSMLIKNWTPSFLCSMDQACCFHSQGYLVVLVGSWCSSYHALLQPRGRKKGKRVNWEVPLSDEPAFSFPEVPHYTPFTFWLEFSHMAISSCKRVWK